MAGKRDKKGRFRGPGPGRPKGRRDLSPVERERIGARRLAGESIQKIAKEERVTKQTVIRVLSRAEFQALQATYRSKAMEAVPDAVAYLHRRITQGLKAGKWKDVPGATQAAVKILEGMQVLVPRQQMDLAAQTAAGPEKVESAVLDKDGDRAVVLVRDSHGATANDAPVGGHGSQLSPVPK